MMNRCVKGEMGPKDRECCGKMGGKQNGMDVVITPGSTESSIHHKAGTLLV